MRRRWGRWRGDKEGLNSNARPSGEGKTRMLCSWVGVNKERRRERERERFAFAFTSVFSSGE